MFRGPGDVRHQHLVRVISGYTGSVSGYRILVHAGEGVVRVGFIRDGHLAVHIRVCPHPQNELYARIDQRSAHDRRIG